MLLRYVPLTTNCFGRSTGARVVAAGTPELPVAWGGGGGLVVELGLRDNRPSLFGLIGRPGTCPLWPAPRGVSTLLGI